MSAPSAVFFTLLFVLGYLVAPAMLVWGWVRWIKQRPLLWTISSTLSFVGFLLASASGLFAIWVILHFASQSGTGREPDYSFFYRCVGRGAMLSLVALVFSIGGAWRRSSLRWLAPTCAIGTLAFWLLATTWP